MSRRWAVRLDKTEVESIEKLRLASGAEVCERAEEIWVRGETLDEPLARLLRRHPHARRHWVMDDDQLVSPGRCVPRGYLPKGPWKPLREWLTVRLPTAASAARIEARVPIQMLRSVEERTLNVLITDLTRWHAYASRAPQIRLQRWFFAAAADRRVVVRGTPLPPLPGQQYAEEDGVAVSAGWTWFPRVEACILHDLLGLKELDLALLHSDGTWERVRCDQFVRATRSAVRHTARGWEHG